MIPCKICEGKATFATVAQLDAHTKAIHGFPLPDVLAPSQTDREALDAARRNLRPMSETPIALIVYNQAERIALERALAIAGAVNTADAIQLFRNKRSEEGQRTYELSLLIRTIQERLELVTINQEKLSND